ncbi:GlxA family transcriptional regulator [Sabulicella glaciei]|uniref:Helix-turn-helix domain-containing protein n=1 Tax=Sabulicella glaciei TaxID=2984948 RepID=A0ABT3NXI4_9PROT|nr:helix-turn-helix domain-containing protein [Roseococcus sp. MDT2-1-1]MCW8086887.1 helix-turn-helix domain-containing protein [Roseococcus sp. MDT2-1-1]
MTTPFAPARVSVCLIAVPEIATGVLNGFFEVLSFVGSGWEMLTGWSPGPRRFTPRIVAASREPLRNLVGLPVTPDLSFAEAKRADIVIVCDLAVGRDEETRGRWPEAVEWLRRQHAQGALVCSVCTGSLMLAEAGLLDGMEATCHWAATDQIRSRYPDVRLRPERVLVTAGTGHRLVTSGANASWTDLALYLVARFCGEEEARRTAKLFLFGDRSDGQLPFAARVRPRQHDDAAVAAAQAWIADNYARANPVAGMTQVSGLAARSFVRRFQSVTGYAPLDYVQSLRIEEAKQMLETTDAPIDAIAEEVGYTEPAAFRRIFKRNTGIAPHQYRQRFRWMAVPHTREGEGASREGPAAQP